MQITLIVIGSILLIGLIYIFNRFVQYRNNVKDAWSNIDVFLKKRYELIPNLVNTVKGYAKHEETTLINVAKARSNAMSIPDNQITQREAAEGQLSNFINRVVILQESYPDLKANNSFIKLQNELAEIEQDLERARRYYNATVRENNTFGESFPGNLFARIFRYQKYEFFSIKSSEREIKEIEL